MDEVVRRLLAQGRCAKCKNMRKNKTVTCERCNEYKYCSEQCLEADKVSHILDCHVIGMTNNFQNSIMNDVVATVKPAASEDANSGNQNNAQPSKKKSRKKKKKSKEERGKFRVLDSNSSSTSSFKQDFASFYGDLDNDGDDDSDDCRSKRNEGKCQLSSKDKTSLGGSSLGATFKKGFLNSEKYLDDRDDICTSSCNNTITGASSGESGKTATSKKNSQTKSKNATCVSSSSGSATKSSKSSASTSTQQSTQTLCCEAAASVSKSSESSLDDSDIMDCCCSCEKPSTTLLTCSRCKSSKYCNKECQLKHFPEHKSYCKRKMKFLQGLAKIEPLIKLVLQKHRKVIETDLWEIYNEATAPLYGWDSCLLVQIVEPWFHPFRYGVKVQDEYGETCPMLFYTDTDVYLTLTDKKAIPLSSCLQPGNFILLLEPAWHNFADGTTGFRIDDMDSVYFVFMDK